jgi:hypothetical protein
MGFVKAVLQTVVKLVCPNFLGVRVSWGDPTLVLLVANASAVGEEHCLIVAFVASGFVFASVTVVSAWLAKSLKIGEIAWFANGAGCSRVTNSAVISAENLAEVAINEVTLIFAGDAGGFGRETHVPTFGAFCAFSGARTILAVQIAHAIDFTVISVGEIPVSWASNTLDSVRAGVIIKKERCIACAAVSGTIGILFTGLTVGRTRLAGVSYCDEALCGTLSTLSVEVG